MRVVTPFCIVALAGNLGVAMGQYQYPGNNSDEPYRSPVKQQGEDRVDAYTEWETLVAEYTKRNLTKDSDRIPAILGLANVMGRFLNANPSWAFGMVNTSSAVFYGKSAGEQSGCAMDYSMTNLDGGRTSSWPTSLVAIDKTQWSIALKGPVGKLTPEQIESLTGHLGFGFTTKLSMDDDPKQSQDEPLSKYLDYLSGKTTTMSTWNNPSVSLLQGCSVWYIDLVKYEHGAGHQGYGYPMWPSGQPASVIRLLLEAADSEELPRSFRRIGIAHMQLEELEGVVREVVIV
ncbi:unnamed protein product [Fusarium equiseti]|uniref:Uncharacterized protein n=1 Tax=Fusarium equiseti TaxID=61235 RepID=A0A8J2N9S2_FUSEQ|nr:unnamed protein product [Fusarium equiseti]